MRAHRAGTMPTFSLLICSVQQVPGARWCLANLCSIEWMSEWMSEWVLFSEVLRAEGSSDPVSGSDREACFEASITRVSSYVHLILECFYKTCLVHLSFTTAQWWMLGNVTGCDGWCDSLEMAGHRGWRYELNVKLQTELGRHPGFLWVSGFSH